MCRAVNSVSGWTRVCVIQIHVQLALPYLLLWTWFCICNCTLFCVTVRLCSSDSTRRNDAYCVQWSYRGNTGCRRLCSRRHHHRCRHSCLSSQRFACIHWFYYATSLVFRLSYYTLLCRLLTEAARSVNFSIVNRIETDYWVMKTIGWCRKALLFRQYSATDSTKLGRVEFSLALYIIGMACQLSHACTVVPECFKDNNESQCKSIKDWKIWPPAVSKTTVPIVTKFGISTGLPSTNWPYS